jgi:hypothetical protein
MMNISFKRNDVQEFIESELGCSNIQQWSSYKSALETWEITDLNLAQLKLCVKSDINSYFFKALQSFIQALHEINSKKFAWSIVKLYYTIFYLLRCEILLSNNIIVRCKTLYYAKIDIGEKMQSYNSNKFKGDHQLTIALEEKLYNSGELTDPILNNKIDEKNPYMWFMDNRDRVNYQMKDFSDPLCDVYLNHVIPYFEDKELVKLFQFYNTEDYSICLDKDHALLAIPYKKLQSVYQRIVATMIINDELKQKIIETSKLLLDLGFKRKDINNLINNPS